MLPKNLVYGKKVESSMARSYIGNCYPNGQLSGYNKGTQCTILIPTRNNLALVSTESMLNFDLTLTGTNGVNAARMDSSYGHGFIQRIRVFHGSNMIENFENYGNEVKKIFDLQVSDDATNGKLNILAGSRSDSVTAIPVLTVTAGLTIGADGITNNYNSGRSLSLNSGTPITYNFSLNLISLLGTLSTQYVPLWKMTASDIRLEITFVQDVYSAIACLGSVSDFRIDNIQYIAQYIELSDTAIQIIEGSLGGKQFEYVIPGMENFTFTTNIQSNSIVNFPIAAKYQSLKSLIVSQRDTAKGVSTASYFPYSSTSMGSSTRSGVSNYQFKIGSVNLPSIPPANNVQFFGEVLKVFGSISDTSYNPGINFDSYNLPVPIAFDDVNTKYATGNVNSGSFYIGIDLENYPGSNNEKYFSGYNTVNDNIFCNIRYSSSAATVANVRYDALAIFDAILTFSNGICYRSI